MFIICLYIYVDKGVSIRGYSSKPKVSATKKVRETLP
jgi:hypothetical protein